METMNIKDFKRLKVIGTHVGLARWLAESDEGVVGYIPKPLDLPSPYLYSRTRTVLRRKGVLFFHAETRHKHYEIFEVPPEIVKATEDEAAGEKG